MLEDLLGERIAKMVGDEKNVAELRVRVGRPLLACLIDGKRKAVSSFGAPYIVTQKDVEDILARATNMSFYSASDEIKRGYVARARLSSRAAPNQRHCGQNRFRRIQGRQASQHAYRIAYGRWKDDVASSFDRN